MPENEKAGESRSKDSSSVTPKTIKTDELFEGSKEIWIEHKGMRYRLCITRRNKLILRT